MSSFLNKLKNKQDPTPVAAPSEQKPGFLQRLFGRFEKSADSPSDVVATKTGTTPSKSYGKNYIPTIGISIKWLIGFAESDKVVSEILKDEAKASKYSIREFVIRVKEITKEYDESVGEMLQRTKPAATKEKADVFVSYAWIYLLRDMIEVLKTLLSGEEDIFIWMDSLVMSQHKADRQEYDTDFWTKTFHTAINHIGRVAVVMTPWDNPYNLTRSWCLWELYGTTLNPETKVEVKIVPSQRGAFREALRKEPEQLIARLGKIDVAKAEAFSKSDQEMILNAAKSAEGGIEAVQESVVDPIRKWMAAESIALIEELEKDGGNKKELAFMSRCVGQLFRVQGLLDQAEVYSKKAVDLFTEVFGVENAETATAMDAMGAILYEEGKYDDAEPFYRKALEVRKKEFGEEHQAVAESMDGLAGNLKEQSKYVEAEPLYVEALRIRRKLLGEEHGDVSISYNNLGYFYESQGRYEEAEPLYQKSLEIDRKNYGNDHPDVGTSLSGVGRILQCLGRYKEAEECFRVSYEIDKKAMGSEHGYVAIDCAYLASLLCDAGRLEEAHGLCDKALQIGKTAFPEVHPRIAYFNRVLAEVLMGEAKLSEAEEKAQVSVDMYKKVYEDHPEHPDIADALLVLARVKKAAGKDFMETKKQCLEMYDKVIGANHPKTKKAQALLG